MTVGWCTVSATLVEKQKLTGWDKAFSSPCQESICHNKPTTDFWPRYQLKRKTIRWKILIWRWFYSNRNNSILSWHSISAACKINIKSFQYSPNIILLYWEKTYKWSLSCLFGSHWAFFPLHWHSQQILHLKNLQFLDCPLEVCPGCTRNHIYTKPKKQK